MKAVSACIGIMVLVMSVVSCKNDHMEPEPVIPPDPRLVYVGDYHFTVTHTSSSILNPNPSSQTTTYDGTVAIDPASTDGIIITYGPYPNSNVVTVRPDNTGHFTVGQYAGSGGTISADGVIDMYRIVAQSPGSSSADGVYGERIP